MVFRMHTPRQARSTETRRRFVEAAKELFAVHRFEDVSARLIAKRADRSPSTLFNYWQDKAAIWREVMGCEPPGDTLERRSEQERAPRQEATALRLMDLLQEMESGMGMEDVRAVISDVVGLLNGKDAAEAAPLLPVQGKTDRDPLSEGRLRVDRRSRSERDPPRLRDDLAVAIGARIRARRRLLGLALSHLSEPLRVSMQQVHRYELGKAALPSTALVRIARELRCSPLELLGSDLD